MNAYNWHVKKKAKVRKKILSTKIKENKMEIAGSLCRSIHSKEVIDCMKMLIASVPTFYHKSLQMHSPNTWKKENSTKCTTWSKKRKSQEKNEVTTSWMLNSKTITWVFCVNFKGDRNLNIEGTENTALCVFGDFFCCQPQKATAETYRFLPKICP